MKKKKGNDNSKNEELHIVYEEIEDYVDNI